MTSTLSAHALPPLAAERAEDAPEVERLIARVFGPGRYVRAAERLREGNRPRLDLSFVARQDGRIVGCVRQWPVRIGERPAILLGPFAVEQEFRDNGLGAALIARACEAVAGDGGELVILVGDEPYFGPLGFSAEPARAVRMPGPVDQRRVLVRGLTLGADQGLNGPVAVPGA